MVTETEATSAFADPRFRLICEEVIAGMSRYSIQGVSLGVWGGIHCLDTKRGHCKVDSFLKEEYNMA
jgi:hypothetical protein